MKRESPITSLFMHKVAQTGRDLGRDKGEMRCVLETVGRRRQWVSAYYLQKNILLTGRLWGKASTCIWRWGWKARWHNLEGKEWGRETVNEPKVGKHIGEIVMKVGLRGGRCCQNRSRTPALSWQWRGICVWETHRCLFYVVRASNFNFFLIQYVWNNCGLEQDSLRNLGLYLMAKFRVEQT